MNRLMNCSQSHLSIRPDRCQKRPAKLRLLRGALGRAPVNVRPERGLKALVFFSILLPRANQIGLERNLIARKECVAPLRDQVCNPNPIPSPPVALQAEQRQVLRLELDARHAGHLEPGRDQGWRQLHHALADQKGRAGIAVERASRAGVQRVECKFG